jgi:hypothetical protein
MCVDTRINIAHFVGIHKKCSVIVVIRGTVDCGRIENIASGAAIERGNLLAFEFS